MLKNYLKIALRHLRRRKGYAAINVAGLVIGLASCILIGLWVRHELRYDDFHAKADRIYRATTTFGPKGPYATTPSLIAPVFRRTFPEVQTATRLYDAAQYRSFVVQRGARQFREERFFYADSTFFEVFSFDVLAGSAKTALTRPNTIVLTETAAQKYFGDGDPVGKTLTVNNRLSFEVTAIISDVPEASHFHFNTLASLMTLQDWSQLSDDEVHAANFYTYLLLQSEEAAASLRQKIPALIERFVDGAGRAGAHIGLQPLTRIHLYSHIESEIESNGDIRYVYIFSVTALLILLVACANYVNLTTARAAHRAREVGTRKALGAKRGQLARQFYAESVLLTFVALGVALLVAHAALPLLNAISGKELTIPYTASPALLPALVGLGVGVSALAGSYPAFVLSSFQPIRVIKAGTQIDAGGALFRKGLVVVQFAVSIFLLIGTGAVYSQLDYMQNRKLGFDKERVVILPVPNEQAARALRREVAQHANVQHAVGVSDPPGSVRGLYKGAGEGVPKERYPFVLGVAADPGIVEALGLTVVAGRGFRPKPDDYTPSDGNYVYLLNEATVTALGWTPDEAIGKRFNLLGGREGEVVGVVENFHFASMRQTIEPLAFYVQPRQYQHLLVKTGSGDLRSTLAALETAWARISPDRPFDYAFLDQTYDALYRQEARVSQIMSVFAIIAILIAGLGLFGLTAYAAQQRTKEIGVRKVLGATAASIVLLLSKDVFKLIGLAFVVAVPVAYFAVQRWLENFAYRIEVGPGLLALAGALALLIAGIAVSYHTLRAAQADPARSLRYE